MNYSRIDEELLKFKMRTGRILGEMKPLKEQIDQGLDNLSTQEYLILEVTIRKFRLSLLGLLDDVRKVLGVLVTGGSVEVAHAYFEAMQVVYPAVNMCGEMSEVLRSHINEAKRDQTTFLVNGDQMAFLVNSVPGAKYEEREVAEVLEALCQ